MKKLFFPLVVVVGLTAMSFTDVKAETVEVKEVSMENLNEEIEGNWVLTETAVRHQIKRTLVYSSPTTEMGDKIDQVLNKY